MSSENPLIYCIDARVVGHVSQIYDRLHDIVQRATRRFKYGLHILEGLFGLSNDIIRYDLAGTGVQSAHS